MARRVDIINSLEMMGYSVLELDTEYLVALRTGSGLTAGTSVSKEDIEFDVLVLEKVVRSINGVIKNDLLGVERYEDRRIPYSNDRKSPWI